jgi:mRNA interferase RelE/StbE
MWSAILAWQIEFDPDALKELKKLDRPVQIRLVTFLRDRLAPLDDPRSIGEALSGVRLGSYWKYRVGDWCVGWDASFAPARLEEKLDCVGAFRGCGWLLNFRNY